MEPGNKIISGEKSGKTRNRNKNIENSPKKFTGERNDQRTKRQEQISISLSS
jgi:hypothetical protein